jgi:hypothetical protein
MNRAEVVEDLKKYAPSSLKCTLMDGTEKPVAVPKAGNRWARTQQVLDSLSWVTIEALDKDGRTLGIVEDDAELDAFDEEDLPAGNLGMAKVMLEVMRTTMKECRMQTDVVVKGQAELMASVSEAMRYMAESYRTALANQQSIQAVAASPGESAEMMQMFQMAMAMMANQKKVGPGNGG